MSEFFTFNCAIIGTNTAFSVKLNKTQLVAELKERIKTAKFKVLASVEADRLTLYKVNLDVSTAETNSKVLQAIEQNSVYCVREELQVQLSELSSTFKETDLPKTAIHVLVKCPAAPPPILVQPSKGLKREAAAILEPETTKRQRALSPILFLTGPDDPDLARDFLQAETPLALYSDHWGKGKNTIVENDNEFYPKSPDLPPLYLFDQYYYMRDRIDFFRSQPQRTITPPGVAVIGIPGIGKSSFLYYYLAYELAQSKPVVYYRHGTCTIFVGHKNGCRAYATKKVPHFGWGFHNILCLVDADGSTPAPDDLLEVSPLFVVMVASPRKAHTHRWMKERECGASRLFVLNPPSEDEVVRALRIQNRVDPSTPDEKIRLAFRLYGPNLRTLARVLLGPTHEQGIQHKITRAVEVLSPSTLKAVFFFQSKASEYIPDTIATSICPEHPKSGDERYLVDDLPEVTFADPIVWEALVRAHKAVAYVELTHLLSIFAIIPQARGLGGWLWRHWVHAQMIKGGDFTLRRIHFQQSTKGTRQTEDTEEPPPVLIISTPPRTPPHFIDKEQFSSNYFIPHEKNGSAFDSLFHQAQGIGLHITIGPTHSLDMDSLKNLRTRLRDPNNGAAEPWLVAAIPKGQSFRYIHRPSDRNLKQFRFYKMELDLPDGIPPEAFQNDEMTKRLEAEITIYHSHHL